LAPLKITECEIFRYDLPLRNSLEVNNVQIRDRSGFLIRISDQHRNLGIGEVAPLPGLHKENLAEALGNLLEVVPLLESREIPPGLERLANGFENWIGKKAVLPSVRFGLEMAILNLLADHCNLSLGRLLSQSCQQAMQINGLLFGEGDQALEDAKRLVRDGYRTIKMKVGRESIDEEIRVVNRLREIINEKARLRIDANRRWSFAQALRFAKSVGLQNIEYIEEPCPDSRQLNDFFDQTEMPIALDESLDELSLDGLENIGGLKALVIKPSVIGGFERSMRLVRYGIAHQIYPVISSAFESGLGLCALANFAASLNLENTAMGLDTYRWFVKDLLERGFKTADGKVDVEVAYSRSREINYGLLRNITSN
jgi:o-succinylbenzoate synthase